MDSSPIEDKRHTEVVVGRGEIDRVLETDTGRQGGEEAQAQDDGDRDLCVSVQLDVPEQRDGHEGRDPVGEDVDGGRGI